LAESLTREQAAREHAERANRAKDDFLAALSHELRTPINPVLLLASDAAKNRDLPLSARSDFEIIRKNVELEARLIDDLLDLTRITFGKLFLDLRMVDAYAILQDAISAAKPDLDAKQIKPTLDLNAEEHNVLADAVRLQQVFWNILKNAVKFTPEKGQITVESSVSADGESLCVKVIDSGIGMTREELDRIFTAFSRGNHQAARRFGGLGLGLAISRKLIELHSGQISASSSGSGRGSTFTIELPLARPGCNGLLADELPAKEILVNKSKPGSVHILLVEDHAPTRDALTRLLLRRNFKVASAASLAEARKLAAEKRFDLVISDIGLPDGSGNDLMAELNRDHGLKGAALTGCGMEQDVERSLASGFLTHLTKPVGIDSLEKALSLLMS
jgi:CheY-like chemotaxis protein